MANTPVLSLKSLIVPTKSVEVEYPGMPGFKLNISYMSKEMLLNIRKKSTDVKFKRNQAKPEEELNEETFLKLYVGSAIKGWTGLKLSYLQNLVPVDMTGQNLDDELPYSEDNALSIIKASADFDSYITDMVGNLQNFTTNSTSA